MLTEEIIYQVLEIHAKRIRELVESKKYKNPDDFLKSAIEVLLTWESSHPEECIKLMKTLMPFSAEQEVFMKRNLDLGELEKHFDKLEIDDEKYERSKQEILAQTHDDHLKLQDNLQQIKKYISNLKIIKPKNIIPYDGYPLLAGGYSRLLPVKISITVLGDLLEKAKESKVEIKELRIHVYDILEEIGSTLGKYEKEKDIPRNQKKSTGLPKRNKNNEDEIKNAIATKRFKDLFAGRIRNSKIEEKKSFEGALSALNLAYAFEEDDKTFVSLTELGKEFLLMENPLIQGDYSQGSLTKLESDFILNKLIPSRKLEKQFIDTAISTIKQFEKEKTTRKNTERITDILDKKFRVTAKEYLRKNPVDAKKFNLDHLDEINEAADRKIGQLRLATMGRLSELKIVKWEINEDSSSEYALI